MTHEEVDKLLRPPRRSSQARREPAEEWVIRTRFRYPSIWGMSSSTDGVAYWGRTRDGSKGLTLYRSNATRYESENTALYEAYSYKEAGLIDGFEVEKLPPKPIRKSGMDGTGGHV